MEKEFYRIEVHKIHVLDMFAPTSPYNELYITSKNEIGWSEKFVLDYNAGFLTYKNKTYREIIRKTLIPYVEEY